MCIRTDDPIADYERHEAEREDKLHKLPRCVDCGEAIQDDYLFCIYGETYCEDCLKESFRKRTEDYIDDN